MLLYQLHSHQIIRQMELPVNVISLACFNTIVPWSLLMTWGVLYALVGLVNVDYVDYVWA